MGNNSHRDPDLAIVHRPALSCDSITFKCENMTCPYHTAGHKMVLTFEQFLLYSAIIVAIIIIVWMIVTLKRRKMDE